MSVTYDFSGKHAVVTGGASGIGLAAAMRLRDAGARITVWDLKPPAAKNIAFARVDVVDGASIAAATEAATKGGTIDCLVHCAGYLGPSAPTDTFDPAEWRRLIEVNLIGTYEIARHVVPVMKRTGRGRIVFLASIAGKEGTPNASAYSASKAGVIGFTKALAKELAGTEILVNCMAPGPIETPLLSQTSAEHLRQMIERSPKKRLASTAECAEMILWLCSDVCTFNTGAAFDLSGGRATY